MHAGAGLDGTVSYLMLDIKDGEAHVGVNDVSSVRIPAKPSYLVT